MERKYLPLHVHTGVVHRSPLTAIPLHHPADPPTTQPGKIINEKFTTWQSNKWQNNKWKIYSLTK